MKTFAYSLVLSGIALLSASAVKAQSINAFAGNHTAGYSGDNNAATDAQCYAPAGVAVDNAGNVYFCEIGNSVIRKVSPSGIISTVAGTGVQGFSGNGGPATAAMINQPTSVAVDKYGNIYFTDDGNNMIRMIDPSGIINTIVGTGVAGNADGLATAAQLNGPSGIAVNKNGSIFIADVYNHSIKRLDTGVVTTICGNGLPGSSGNGSSASIASLSYPKGVAVDTVGNVYIVDQGNSSIRRINAAGIINAYAGNSSFGYSGDGGLGYAAALNTPTEVVVDHHQNAYIADYGNHVIRKVTVGGYITTIAGNHTNGYSGDGGPAIAAQMAGPYGVAFDNSNGKLYISDEVSNVIRVVNTNTTGINTPSVSSNALHIYPNPSYGEVTIDIPANTDGQMEVIDMAGRTVQTIAVTSQSVIVRNLPAGSYFIKLNSGTDVYHDKLTVLQ